MSTTRTEIAWTDRSWNPVRGCSRVSEGCRNCYAEKMAARFSGPGLPFEGFAKHVITDHTPGEETREGRWTGRVELIPGALAEPLSWRKPARIFVNSMSDLFHEALLWTDIAAVFAVMAGTPRHTFQILTKRPERTLEFSRLMAERNHRAIMAGSLASLPVDFPHALQIPASWPLQNVWLGVSVEDQKTADERIPLLLQTPAAVRFVSYEPALGPVDFEPFLRRPGAKALKLFGRDGYPGVDWIIVGGESGPGARPFHVDWARSVVRQCKAAGVAVFVKQLGARCFTDDGAGLESCGGAWPSGTRAHVGVTMDAPRWVQFRDRKGGDIEEFPSDLRVREFPTPRTA